MNARRLLPPLLWLLAGCATVPLNQHLPVALDHAHFDIAYSVVDRTEAPDVASVLPFALSRLNRWGTFSHPITIYIRPTHAALESAAFHPGYAWLRAWARYDTIDLQSPRTWGPANRAQVAELLTHELTHCLMYQASTSSSSWMFVRIPLWFREGMASVTSNQGYRRLTRQALADWLAKHRASDPVGRADDIYESEPAVVYSAAHRAFEALDARFGDAAVLRLMARMAAGSSFADAFRDATGIPEEDFERDFVRGVREHPERDW